MEFYLVAPMPEQLVSEQEMKKSRDEGVREIVKVARETQEMGLPCSTCGTTLTLSWQGFGDGDIHAPELGELYEEIEQLKEKVANYEKAVTA